MTDRTRYNLTIDGFTTGPLHKNRAILEVVRHLILCRNRPVSEIAYVLDHISGRHSYFVWVDGVVDSAEFIKKRPQGAKSFSPKKFFSRDDELLHVGGRTYAFYSQWNDDLMHAALEALAARFNDVALTWQT